MERPCSVRSGNRIPYAGQFGQLPRGYDHKYVYSRFGCNLKITDLQAVIGCELVKKLPGFVERRRHNWSYLRRVLQPVEDKIILPELEPRSRPSWFSFLMTARQDVSRESVVRYIEEKSIQTRMLFSGNLLKHPCFDEVRGDRQKCRVAGAGTHRPDFEGYVPGGRLPGTYERGFGLHGRDQLSCGVPLKR